MLLKVVFLLKICYNYTVMDDPKNTSERFSSPEQRPQDQERLRAVGDLLVDASTLIQALNTYHQADQIDHELTFPILPRSSVHIPEAFSLTYPDYITITAGKTKTKQEDTKESTVLTYLSIDIVAGKSVLKISREGEHSDDDTDDIIMDTTQNDPTRTLRDELRGETDAEFAKRLNPVNKVSRREVNNLLMSLALPENEEYSHFADKDLLDLETFTFLTETLRIKALETNTIGTYIFQKSETELSFQKKDGDESFSLNYSDPKTGQAIIVSVDTSIGFDLRFSIYNQGSIYNINPTNEEIAFVHNLIKMELGAVIEVTESVEDYLKLETDDPEDIAVQHVEERDALAHKRLEREIGHILNQDGFDTPNAGA